MRYHSEQHKYLNVHFENVVILKQTPWILLDRGLHVGDCLCGALHGAEMLWVFQQFSMVMF